MGYDTIWATKHDQWKEIVNNFAWSVVPNNDG
jgi:hypothetical protein